MLPPTNCFCSMLRLKNRSEKNSNFKVVLNRISLNSFWEKTLYQKKILQKNSRLQRPTPKTWKICWKTFAQCLNWVLCSENLKVPIWSFSLWTTLSYLKMRLWLICWNKCILRLHLTSKKVLGLTEFSVRFCILRIWKICLMNKRLWDLEFYF